MNDVIEPMSWWTGKGFVMDAPTPSIVTAINGCDDWVAAMQDAGYDRIYSTRTGHEPVLEVWLHEDGHLYIDVADRTAFLVARERVTAFWVELLPVLEAPYLAHRQTEALELQAKAMIAWIRHGSGKGTIGEFGHTRDEELRWQEHQQQLAARTKAKG